MYSRRNSKLNACYNKNHSTMDPRYSWGILQPRANATHHFFFGIFSLKLEERNFARCIRSTVARNEQYSDRRVLLAAETVSRFRRTLHCERFQYCLSHRPPYHPNLPVGSHPLLSLPDAPSPVSQETEKNSAYHSSESRARSAVRNLLLSFRLAHCHY